jgi:hypothetical protein
MEQCSITLILKTRLQYEPLLYVGNSRQETTAAYRRREFAAKGSASMEDINIGSLISFGSFKWRVLDIQNDTALVITEDIIEQRSYHDAYTDITWAECSLRRYLNGEFYDKFTETEKSRIFRVK